MSTSSLENLRIPIRIYFSFFRLLSSYSSDGLNNDTNLENIFELILCVFGVLLVPLEDFCICSFCSQKRISLEPDTPVGSVVGAKRRAVARLVVVRA